MAISLPQSPKLIEIDELNCPICQERYDNALKNPRMLPCGHIFCTACLSSIIQQVEASPNCPECRTRISVTYVELLPICYLVKKIIDSVNELNKDILKKFDVSDINRLASDFQACVSINANNNQNSSTDNILISNKNCNEHMVPKQLWCDTCKIFICVTCALVEHCRFNEANKPNCVVCPLKDAIKFLKPLQQKKICSQMNIISRIINHFRLLQKRARKSTKWNDILGRKDELEDDLDMLDVALENIDESNSPENTIPAIEYAQNIFVAKCYPLTEEDILKGFWKHFLNSYDDFEPALVDFNSVSLIATCTINGKRKQTEGLLTHNMIRFFHVADIQITSPNPIYFHLSDLFIPGLRTFFRLSQSNLGYIGTVVFKLLDPDSLRASHFRALCSGEAGPSYQGSYFLDDNGLQYQYLSIGDYEFNNKTGGNSLFTIIEEEYENKWNMAHGIVCGLPVYQTRKMGQFKIFYSIPDDRAIDPVAKGAFAFVEEGMELLVRVATSNRWPDVYVSSCGVGFYTAN